MWAELGSRLYLLPRACVSQREMLAKEYVAEALAEESGLEVTAVSLADQGTLRVDLLWQGDTLSVTLNGVTG